MKSGFYDRSYLLRHELGNHTDVVIDNPQNNDVIQYDSTLGVFRNSPIEAAELGPASDVRDYLEVYSETEVNDLISAITPTTQLYDGGPDLPYADVDAFLDDVNVYSDLDVDALLADKQNTLTGTSDVPGLDTALAGKSDTGHGHALTDSAITGVLPASKGGLGFDASSLGVSSAEFGYLDGVTSPIQTQLDGKQAVDSDLTALAGITVARGTIPVGNSSPAWSGLAKGAAYLPLRMDSSGNDPGYGALQPQGGGTGQTSYTAGDILYCSATNVLSKLAKGTDGQFLKLVSGFPEWAAGGSGVEYVTTIAGANSLTYTQQTLATSATLSAGTYLFRFDTVPGSATTMHTGYQIGSGSTVWVIGDGAGGNLSIGGIAQSRQVTLSGSDTISLRGYSTIYVGSASLEIWRIT